MDANIYLPLELSLLRLIQPYYPPQDLSLIHIYDKLNDLGKHEALKRVEELTFIDKYVDTEYLMPIAAHAKDGVSKEDIKHDLEMMNDENW